MREYFAGIWAARYFWMHLAMADLRARWRRSFFGVLWSMLQPLGTALLLAIVLARLLQQDIRSYAPYVISGMIVWDFVMAVSTGGALSFVQADAYIKHFRHPLAIYSLRTVIANLTVLGLASVPMFVWAAIAQPKNLGITWLGALSIGLWMGASAADDPPGDGLAAYLIGKNLMLHDDFPRAAAFLDRALRAGAHAPSITPRIGRELLRTRAVCACALRDSVELAAIVRLVLAADSPFADHASGRRDWLLRLIDRCGASGG